MPLNLATFKTRLRPLAVDGAQVLYLSFNQKFDCISVGTTRGFKIFNCDPFGETYSKDFPGSGIAIVEMLFRCNILALVGDGQADFFPINQVRIWDDHTGTNIGELTFPHPVRAVRLRRDKVLIAVDDNIYLYNFDVLALSGKIKTFTNPRGCLSVSPSPDIGVFFCPGEELGTVYVERMPSKDDPSPQPSFPMKGSFLANDSGVACLSSNHDGSLVAVASERGTLIRVFETVSGSFTKVFEARRGSTSAEIYCINFSNCSRFLCCSSAKGTIHVWRLSTKEKHLASSTESQQTNSQNRKWLSALSGVSPYFKSEWSFAWWKGPADLPSLCSFAPDPEILYVVFADTSFFKLQMDPVKGRELRVVPPSTDAQ